jgi:hypothetical protein
MNHSLVSMGELNLGWNPKDRVDAGQDGSVARPVISGNEIEACAPQDVTILFSVI